MSEPLLPLSAVAGEAAGLLLDENLGEAEAAAGKFAGVLVADEGDAFFTDFGKVDFPSFAAKGFRIDFGAGHVLAWRRLRAAGALGCCGCFEWQAGHSGGRIVGRIVVRWAFLGGRRGGRCLEVALALAPPAFALAIGGGLATAGWGLGLRPVAGAGRGFQGDLQRWREGGWPKFRAAGKVGECGSGRHG